MYKLLIAVTVAASLTGCSSAMKSTEVQASRAPVAPYLKMDCKELLTEQQSVLRDIETQAAAVDAAYSSDKGVEVVTWLLFAPAAFALKGNAQQSAALAASKGQLDAISDAMNVNECTG